MGKKTDVILKKENMAVRAGCSVGGVVLGVMLYHLTDGGYLGVAVGIAGFIFGLLCCKSKRTGTCPHCGRNAILPFKGDAYTNYADYSCPYCGEFSEDRVSCLEAKERP